MGGFLNPGMALFALAGLIPIIIHLLNKQRYKKIRWAAMEFLLQALKKTRRRLQMENLLLLLIRTTIVILLALGLSRCYLKESPLAIGTVDTHAIIVIDDSYSMNYKTGLKTYFEQSKEIAIQLIDTLKTSRGDKVSLLTASGNPFAPAGGLIADGSSDLEQAKKIIANLSVSDFGTDLLKTFRDAFEIAGKSDRTHKVFYLITNAQRIDWQATVRIDSRPDTAIASPPSGRNGSAESPETSVTASPGGLAELISNLGKKADLQIIDVSQPQAGNYLITGIEPSRRIITTDSPVTFQAEIRNFNTQPANRVQVDFIVDNFTQDTTAVDLPANGIATVSFNYEFREPGPHWINLRLAPDNLPVDNERYCAVDVKETLKVLLVNGESGPEPFDNETVFLQYALNPNPDETQRGSVYSLEKVSDLIFEDTDVKKYDLVILANLSFVSQSKVKTLEEYVAGGGGLLIFLGDKIDRTVYNELLYRNGDGLLPGELGGIRGDRNHEKAVYLEEVDFTHSALEYLKPLKAQFGKMVIYEFYDVKIDAARRDTRVIARFNTVSDRAASDGNLENSPAIAEKLFGRGKVMLVTTSADAEWNLMPGRKLYVMLVDRLAIHLAAQPAESKNLLVGQSLYLLLKTQDYTPNFSLATPQQGLTTISPSPLQNQTNGGTATPGPKRFMLTYNRTERHGIYALNRLTENPVEEDRRLTAETAPERDTLFSCWAVNLDPAEGNLQCISAEELRQLYPGLQSRKMTDLMPVPETTVAKPPPSSIWKYLIYTVLVLLLLESVLAQRFGAFKK